MTWNSPWRRILFTPVPWLLVVAIVVAQYLVIDDVAADSEGDELLGLVLMIGAVVPVSWAVLETIWLRFAGPSIMVAFARILALPFLMGPILGLTGTYVRLRSGVEQTIEATRRPDGWHYWFDASRGSGTATSDLALIILSNAGAAMLAGLRLVVFVVLPWFAFMRPAQFIEANMMDTSPAAAAANAAGARMISIILMLVFAVPTVIVWLANEDRAGLGWVLGIAMVVIGFFMVRFVLSRQVPDHEARGALPAWSRGVQTLRHERDQESSDGGGGASAR
ncbi:hypothetical protein H1W00_04590 [Aeromicrobium sp. Marseille-Q0843]|uniref:Uncharacterized protein n=1 Tax=Aeromicrobium phoceense TaxID=2754045 RepID=A0A838XG43_9ACTN|nr:hypothetical protein [Aeromicrobium phoceense]MBA4607748.1 hypothetical protein [Aeromicrobium phoceense]